MNSELEKYLVERLIKIEKENEILRKMELLLNHFKIVNDKFLYIDGNFATMISDDLSKEAKGLIKYE